MIELGRRPAKPLYSTGTGQRYPANTAEELYRSLVNELLTQPIRWDSVIDGIIDEAKRSAVTDITVHSFGNSIPLSELSAAIKSRIAGVEFRPNSLMTWALRHEDIRSERQSRSKLAIVGMSCRLPGGATSNEKFWELLESGLDVSRKIPADRFDIETQ